MGLHSSEQILHKLGLDARGSQTFRSHTTLSTTRGGVKSFRSHTYSTVWSLVLLAVDTFDGSKGRNITFTLRLLLSPLFLCFL